MKKINITISGGLGRMGSLLIKKTVQDKQLKLESVTEQKSLTKKWHQIRQKLHRLS